MRPVRRVRRVLGRTGVLVVAIVAVVALSTGTLVAAEVDRRAAHTLPAGTFIGRVDVSGLSFAAAVARVDDRLIAPLRAPLYVEADGFAEDTTVVLVLAVLTVKVAAVVISVLALLVKIASYL